MSDTHDKLPQELQTMAVDQMSPVVAAGMKILENNPNPETLAKLLDVQLRWEANEAKKAYTASLVALHRDLPSIIGHDRKVDYTSKKTGGRVQYTSATLAKIITEIDPHLVKYGFNLSWKTENNAQSVTVTAVLQHEAGHSESTTLSGPHDNSGGKNPVQAIGSTASYLQRYTAVMLLGLATGDVKDADAPPADAGEQVDPTRNRRAAEAIVERGLEVADAAHLVGRPMAEWTGDDLEVIRAWIHGKKDEAKKEGTPEVDPDDELPWENNAPDDE